MSMTSEFYNTLASNSTTRGENFIFKYKRTLVIINENKDVNHPLWVIMTLLMVARFNF